MLINIDDTGRAGIIKTAQHSHGIKLLQAILLRFSKMVFILS
jgi:hypothetical protein